MKLGSWFDDLRARMLGPAAPGVHLGAIGKHPGWDDHMEAIGLDTEPLAAAREILYTNGISKIIDGADWEKDEAALAEFDHVLCWTAESDTLLGRMWSSTDGKGRDRYPMMALAHLGAPFSPGVSTRALETLARLKTACQNTAQAEDVRASFAVSLQELREALTAVAADQTASDPEPNQSTTAQWVSSLGLDKGEGFAWALYAIQRKAEACVSSRKRNDGKINLRMLGDDALSQHVRVPMDARDSIGGIAFWREIVTGFTHTKSPLLFIHPVGRRWLDLLIGVPTAKQLACIKATHLTLISEVPYAVDESFRQEAAKFVAALSKETKAMA